MNFTEVSHPQKRIRSSRHHSTAFVSMSHYSIRNQPHCTGGVLFRLKTPPSWSLFGSCDTYCSTTANVCRARGRRTACVIRIRVTLILYYNACYMHYDQARNALPWLKYPSSTLHMRIFKHLRRTTAWTVFLFSSSSTQWLTGKLVAITRSESSVSTPVRRHDVGVTWGTNRQDDVLDTIKEKVLM